MNRSRFNAPYAGMTRIRFGGCLSSPANIVPGQRREYSQGNPCVNR